MEEPKKVLRAQYLGSTQVHQATGMEILNDAIDRLVASVPLDQWQIVNVAVAPSMITIQQPSVSPQSYKIKFLFLIKPFIG